MSHIPFTLAAYFFNSVAVTIDKFLLTKHVPNPLVYIFYISVFSLVALLLLPFTHPPTLVVFAIASLSTVLWTIGAYCLYKALQVGQTSRVVPVIGTLVPIILSIVAFFEQTITLNEVWAVLLLIIGLVLITLPAWKGHITKQELIFEILSALFFAVSYLFLRQAYLQENFLTVLVYSRLILIPVGLTILIVPNLRKIVLSSKGPKINFLSKVGLLFLIGQIMGGSQELLLTFSVSLANPAVVNSLQGTQYIFLFLFNLILSKKYPDTFKESLSFKILLTKVLAILLIVIGLFILAFSSQVKNQNIPLGVTFSTKYSQELGFKSEELYTKILQDLNIKYIRIPVYWDEVEKVPGQYDFSSYDFYLNEASEKNIAVTLVLGYKQPRWPECFSPVWAKKLLAIERDKKVLDLVKEEVLYFKKFPAIKTWQVENEPLLHFGNCDKPTELTFEHLKEEVAVVRNVDSRPILITDSGELSTWAKALSLGEIFGSTLYRTVWNPILGYTDYPLPPFYYQIKDLIVKKLTGTQSKPSIIAELQAEPWAKKDLLIIEVPISDQVQQFPASKIKDNLNFAKETDFAAIYLWGVEWWYWMAQRGHPEYIETAKQIFQNH